MIDGRKWVILAAAGVTLVSSGLVGAAVLPATADIWVRESAPGANYEVDTISVWSSTSADGARRYALIEFDVSSLAGQPLQSAYISLYSFNRWSQALMPIKQTAYVVPSAGTALESLTWNLYMAEKDAGKVALESLGKYQNGPINADPSQQEVYIDTMAASAADLAAISAEANGDGKLTLVLIADEDGTDYRRDWGDIQWAGKPALLNVEVIPEPVTLALLALGSFGAIKRGRRKPMAQMRSKPAGQGADSSRCVRGAARRHGRARAESRLPFLRCDRESSGCGWRPPRWHRAGGDSNPRPRD